MILRFLLFTSLLMAADPAATFESERASKDFDLTADVNSSQWKKAPAVRIANDYFGKPLDWPATEVRSRWTDKHLYLLYICPYKELNLKPDPSTTTETPQLWNWDVGEVFIGPQTGPITRYREMQVSPQGEWVDLDIDRTDPKGQAGMKWNSGYSVKAKIDSEKKIWYGEMRIPWTAIDSAPVKKGSTFRTGVYRIAGTGTNKLHYAWRPTGKANFHVPEAFGTLLLK